MTRIFEAVAKDGIIVLPSDFPSSARCVVAVLDQDLETLREEAALTISESKQRRMSELLVKNRDAQLSAEERVELDDLSAEFDTATLTKGRALSILAQLDSMSSSS